MTKFLEMFEPIKKGNFGLTDEVIYKSIQTSGDFIPIWGGNKEHKIIDRLVSKNAKTKKGEPITIFSGRGVIISLDGSAGSMTLKAGQEFALNHHAGFFRLKENPEIQVLLEFFTLFCQKQLQDASISEGSKTLTLDQIYSMDFDMPSIEMQKEIVAAIQPFLKKKEKLEKTLVAIQGIRDKFFSNEYEKYQANEQPIKNIIDYMSGNSGLTEQFIYEKSQHSGKRYIVLSSSTEKETKMGEIPMCELNGKPLKVFEDRDGLLVVRNGKAGTTLYLPRGDYTINDHAYILSVKKDCPYKINLKWLSIQYKDEFLSYASSSDNGTWNMTGFFQNVVIDIPDYTEQMKIVEEYEKPERYEIRIKEINEEIHKLTSKVIVQSTTANNRIHTDAQKAGRW
jgi:restriction endonuclease S subunit